jgi:hypothetical protein
MSKTLAHCRKKVPMVGEHNEKIQWGSWESNLRSPRKLKEETVV